MSLTLTLIKDVFQAEFHSHSPPVFTSRRDFWAQSTKGGFVPCVRFGLDPARVRNTSKLWNSSQTLRFLSVSYQSDHQASVDAAPQGPSNATDAASVGQQQTATCRGQCSGGNWHHSACPAVLSLYTHTNTHTWFKNTHKHQTSRWIIYQDSAELRFNCAADYRAVSNFILFFLSW